MEKLIKTYGFNPVTESAKRKELLELLSKKLELFSELELESLDTADLMAYKVTLEQFQQLTRINKSENDVLFFSYQYFSDDMNPDNSGNLIPSGTSIEDAPSFHVELTGKLSEISSTNVVGKLAWASPRGSAKSAYLSNIFPIHEVVFQKRNYIMIISETDSVSKKFVEYVGSQLKHNELLREDFGVMLEVNKQHNEKDNEDGFLTKVGTLVESASIGKQLRGKRNGAYRPDLVICDDLESSKNTNTPELREKNLHWFNSVLLPIGDPKATAFLYMGTAVHKDGLLFEVMDRPNFDSKLYSAILSEPENEDLWDTFETILRDVGNQDRMNEAEAFYESNKEAMDEGVEVLWKSRWSYKELMLLKSTMTSRSFNSEYLNNPMDLTDSVFNPSEFSYFDADDFREVEPFLDYYGSWDLAFTTGKRSDYNAITILGRDRRNGKIYVVESWAKKVQAHVALEQALRIIKEYEPKVFVVETVQGQIDLYRQLLQRMSKEGLYFTKLKSVKPTGKKEARIESLEPLITNGQILFRRTQRLMLEQLEMFPRASHDDCPDSLEMAMQLIGLHGRRKSFHKKPRGL